MSAAFWDEFAGHQPGADLPAFVWSQYPDHRHGPGVGLLGPGGLVLELGCGNGHNLHMAERAGYAVIGVDSSPVQVEAARGRLGDLGEVHHADALDYLAGEEMRFDAVYSVFGAVWYEDPTVLLPAIKRVLTPGGRLVFSHRPPKAGQFGRQESFLNGKDRPPVHRWDYEPAMWEKKLLAAGFADADVEILPPPPRLSDSAGTLIGQAWVE